MNDSNNTKPKIAILYTLAGSGHISVAKALEETLVKKYDIKPITLDLMEDVGPIFLRRVSQTFNFLLEYAQGILELLVSLSTHKYSLKLIKLWINKTSKKQKLYEILQRLDVDIIITTYFVYNNMISDLKKDNYLRSKLVVVPTELSYASGLWFDKNVDKYIFPTQEFKINSSKYLSWMSVNNSVDTSVTGMPLKQIYFEDGYEKILPEENDRNVSALRYFNMSRTHEHTDNPLKILYLDGGIGSNAVFEFCEQLDFGLDDVHIKVAAGKNIELAQKINNSEFKNKVEAFGWIPDLLAYYNWADICIGKSGACTMWEILRLNKPYICKEYIKGAEKGNMEYASMHGNCIYLPRNLQIIQFINNIQKNYRDNISEIFGKDLKSEKYLEDRKYFEKNWAEETVKEILKLK
jgi:processive 1,2-diacylglycerol beta-glucosyltransferase